jgi:riboflavin biosynthesis pyrimidine reductase
VQQIWPVRLAEVDPVEALRDLPEDAVRIGMVRSADGSATDRSGWTTGLSGPADLELIRAHRTLADAVLVGATTVRTGRLRPITPGTQMRARRAELGKSGPPPIVVVSQSLRLDWSGPLFGPLASPTVLLTTEQAAATTAVPGPVRVVTAGATRLDLPRGLAQLRTELGLRQLLCEGGPALATSMIAAGLVDELSLSLAPVLVGPAHLAPLLADLPSLVPVRLYAVYQRDDTLFVRYRLDRLPG